MEKKGSYGGNVRNKQTPPAEFKSNSYNHSTAPKPQYRDFKGGNKK